MTGLCVISVLVFTLVGDEHFTISGWGTRQECVLISREYIQSYREIYEDYLAVIRTESTWNGEKI